MYSCQNTTMMETHTEIGELPLLFSSVHKRLMALTYSYCAHDTYYHVSNDIKHKCMYVCMYIYSPGGCQRLLVAPGGSKEGNVLVDTSPLYAAKTTP